MQAISYINRMESDRKADADSIRKQERIYPEALEKELTKIVAPQPISSSVCAIDGGLLVKEFHGIDLLMRRAVAVNFKYENSKLISHAYLPNAFPQPDFEIQFSLDEHEVNCFRSLFRLESEIETAIAALDKFSPAYLFMDGSLAPVLSDKPATADSEGRQLYNKVISLYQLLYKKSVEKNCQLIGIIKDSRGKRFLEIVKGKGQARCSDSVFLHSLLHEKERSFAFHYGDPKHSILADLGEWGSRLLVFYLKPSRDDRPLRVEFIHSHHIASFDQIASFVYSLCAINKSYAYPAVLIEADMRAALEPLELERVEKYLSMSTSLMPLRRNSRPFR